MDEGAFSEALCWPLSPGSPPVPQKPWALGGMVWPCSPGEAQACPPPTSPIPRGLGALGETSPGRAQENRPAASPAAQEQPHTLRPPAGGRVAPLRQAAGAGGCASASWVCLESDMALGELSSSARGRGFGAPPAVTRFSRGWGGGPGRAASCFLPLLLPLRFPGSARDPPAQPWVFLGCSPASPWTLLAPTQFLTSLGSAGCSRFLLAMAPARRDPSGAATSPSHAAREGRHGELSLWAQPYWPLCTPQARFPGRASDSGWEEWDLHQHSRNVHGTLEQPSPWGLACCGHTSPRSREPQAGMCPQTHSQSFDSQQAFLLPALVGKEGGHLTMATKEASFQP